MPEIEIRGKKIKIPYTKKGKKLAVKLKNKHNMSSSFFIILITWFFTS